MPKHTFVISDESALNSLGFRTLVSGIRYDQYERNPIVLWMHKRPSKSDSKNDENEVFPIGLASNIRVKDGQLLADIEFDQDDPFAKRIEKKVESGYIRMASAGLNPVLWSKETKYLLAGQKFASLIDSTLEEISIVDIGGDPNSLKLYNNNREIIELSAGNRADFIPLVKTQTKNNSMDFINQVAVLLGMDHDSTENSVMKTLKERIQFASQAEEYKGKYDTLAGEMAKAHEANVIALVEANVDKKFLAEKKDFYITLGKESGMSVLKGVLEQLPELKKPSETIKFSKLPSGEQPAAEAEVKTFGDLRKQGKDAVIKLRKENPAEYIRLYKGEYGIEPDMKDE